MYSENFMRYLIAYQSEDIEQKGSKVKVQKTKRPLMIDLIGVKYATIPIKGGAE